MKNVKDIFLEIIKYDTQSDYNSKTYPSTNSQLEFANILSKKMKAIGMSNVNIDEFGYVTGEIPENKINHKCYTIGFIAHMDTSPDACGKNINPIVTENYDGSDIILKDAKLSPSEFKSLNDYIGDTIISTDGTTLLGADDKAGIAEILCAMEYIIKNDISHGKIKVLFTPDEEVGRGVDYFDVKKFDCDFAYTMDGGKVGSLEYENFNASRVNIEIKGKNVHPGYAKSTMINSMLVANEIISSFPKNETPETTEGYEGFYHIVSINGNVSKCNLSYIIRDFDESNLKKRKEFIISIIDNINKKYGNICNLEIKDEYKNMINQFKDKMYIIDLQKKAMKNLDIELKIMPIRGGTDGARLSFMGLCCPNIFAGGHNFHGIFEYIPVSSMEKASKVIVEICKLATEIKMK